jgi:hypothetical protein
MTSPEAASNPTGTPWQEAAIDPAILAQEQTIVGLRVLQQERAGAEREMTKYYWKNGSPRVTSPDLVVGPDAFSHSYWRDRGAGQDDADTPSMQFEELIPAEGTGTNIGRTANGNWQLVDADGRVISPGYSSMQHMGGNAFQVSGWPHVLTILDEQQREQVLAQRTRLETLDTLTQGSIEQVRDLQGDIAADVLGRYGIPAEAVRREPSMNSTTMHFRYAGRHVRMSITAENLEVVTWDEKLDAQQRLEIWNAHSTNRDRGNQISIMEGYLDTEIPDFLKPYEEKIMADTDNLTAEKREHMQHQRAFNERFGFMDFSVDASQISWALPIALSLINMPIEESSKILASTKPGGSDFMVVSEPGLFMPMGNKTPFAWRLTPESGIEQVRQDDPGLHANENVQAAVRQLEVAKAVAAEEAKLVTPPEAASEQGGTTAKADSIAYLLQRLRDAFGM